MYLYLIGIDYKSAGLGIREAAYRDRERIAVFWAGHGAGKTAMLATCNRFEIYCIAESAIEAKEKIGLFISLFKSFAEYSYVIYGTKDVFRHILRLASGLESQVKGELQISAQLGAWPNRKDFPKALAYIVYDALLAAHDIRARSGLNDTGNNIAALLLKGLLADSGKNFPLEVVVAGTGKIAELFAAHKPQGVRIYFAAHKNILKARALAARSGGTAVSLEELPEILLRADILISATSSPHYIFNKDYFTETAPARKNKLDIYDLAVPRDIDPAVGGIAGVVLRNIDDLTAIFEKHNLSLTERINLASYLAEEASQDYGVVSNDESIKGRYKAEPVGA